VLYHLAGKYLLKYPLRCLKHMCSNRVVIYNDFVAIILHKKLRRIFYLICNSLHVMWIYHTTFLMHQQNLISNIIENMH